MAYFASRSFHGSISCAIVQFMLKIVTLEVRVVILVEHIDHVCLLLAFRDIPGW